MEPASAKSRLSIVKARLVALLAVLVALAACASVAQRSGATANRLSGVSAPASSSPPTSPPGSPTTSTIPDSAFRVAAPVLDFAAGPGPAPVQAACVPADVTATAQTRPIASGVAGVVELVGAHCSLHISTWPTHLLDSAGNNLALPVDATVTTVNPALNQRTDVELAVGSVGWGFTWRGSWCGPKAVSVVIALDANQSQPASGSADQIIAPLTGPAPPCQGHSAAVLIPGVPGGPTDATLTPPPEWAGLRATLTLPATTDGQTLRSAVVQLQNTTGVPLVMSPCPDYALDIDNVTAGGSALQGGGGALPCPQSAQVVPAHGTIRYDLGAQSYDEGDPGGGANSGSTVTARFAIAGIPTARATAIVK
ncbi:MAG TPA: hypothetical protein VIJ31_18815 [Acidothermaceae bacterium]